MVKALHFHCWVQSLVRQKYKYLKRISPKHPQGSGWEPLLYMKVAKDCFSSFFFGREACLSSSTRYGTRGPCSGSRVLTTGPSGKSLFSSFYVLEARSDYARYRASHFIGNQFLEWLWQIYGYCPNRLSKQLDVFVWEPGAEVDNTMAKRKCANRHKPPPCSAGVFIA